MNKTELLQTYTVEQLADMLIKANNLLDMLKYSDSYLKSGLFDNPAVAAIEERLNIAQNRIKNLEEENGRLKAEVDTYNGCLLPKCTKEARRMIDENRFANVRIVTWDEWNNREKSEGEKVLFPKEYEDCIKELLDIDPSEIKDDCHRFSIESLQRYLKMDSPKKQDKVIKEISVVVGGITKTYPIEEIGDIVRTYEDIKHCKEHDGNHLHSEEYLKIISLNREVAKLQSLVGKYRKAFEDTKKERDCQIAEYQKKIEELEQDLKTAREKIQDLASVNMNLQCERNDYKAKAESLEVERMRVKINEIADFLPPEPIKVADMLISATYTRQKSNIEKALHKAFGNDSDTVTVNVYSESELRQIAEHLIVYCNHNEGGEE